MVTFLVLILLLFTCHVNSLVFGFKTCTRKATESEDNTFVTFFWRNQMFECMVVPNAKDTLYTCDSDIINTKECITTETKYAMQISIPRPYVNTNQADDVCIDGLYINGTMINVDQQWVGDGAGNGMYTFRYWNLSDPHNLPTTVIGDTVSGIPVCNTATPTAFPSTAPTPSTYEMIEVTGSYLCVDLTMNTDLLYDITYEQCVYQQCFVNYTGSCVMVNYLGHTNPTRCYIMDKQCEIYDDNASGNRIAIVGYKDFCVDYPMDWTDGLSDACIHYDIFGYCEFGQINVNVTSETAIESKANLRSGFSALDTCCECGGGVDIIDDVTMYFGKSMDNALCSWPYGNPTDGKVYKTWNHLNMYEFCVSLSEKQSISSTDIDCNIFIEKSYSKSCNFYVCDFDEYNQENEGKYFIYIIAVNDGTTNVMINKDWFNINNDLLSTIPVEWTYTQCISSLSLMDTANIYSIIPCDGDTFSPTSNPTMQPTESNTISSFTLDSSDILVFIIIPTVVICILLILIIFCWKRRNDKKSAETLRQKEKQLEMGNASNKPEYPINASAPTLESDEQNKNDNEDKSNCMICCTNKANMAIIPCGHITYCSKCCENALNQTNNQCPLCRNDVTMTTRVYVAGFL